jgi:hypothetical protein
LCCAGGEATPAPPLLELCDPVSDLTDGARDGITSEPASAKSTIFGTGGTRDCSQLDIACPEVEWIEGGGIVLDPWELTDGGGRSCRS